MNADLSVRDLLTIVASGGIGWLVALVTFRTRMDRLEWRATALENTQKSLSRSVERIERAFNSIERRQMVQLQLSADIARKLGIDHRLPEDMLVRLLTDEENTTQGD